MNLSFPKLTAVALLVTGTVFAADPFVGDGMADKGTHGLVNIATGWMEIPVRIKHGYDKGYSKEKNRVRPAESRMAGTVGGLFEGTAAAVGRTFTGVYQLTGFWAANHQTNEGSGHHLGKEYAWQQAAPPEPVPPADRVEAKTKRAFNDVTMGIAEVPVQTDKTWTVDRKADPGFGKGVWFATSRIYGGVFDLVGFALPGYKKTYGYGYDSEHPLGDCSDCECTDKCDSDKK